MSDLNFIYELVAAVCQLQREIKELFLTPFASCDGDVPRMRYTQWAHTYQLQQVAEWCLLIQTSNWQAVGTWRTAYAAAHMPYRLQPCMHLSVKICMRSQFNMTGGAVILLPAADDQKDVRRRSDGMLADILCAISWPPYLPCTEASSLVHESDKRGICL